MTTHAWAKTEDTETSALFRCDVCGVEVRFVKEGYGEPHCGDGSVLPDNADDYVGVCQNA